MKKIYFLLIFLLLSLKLVSQNEATNWYFGIGAGIQFNLALNTVTSVDDGRLFTLEGCASISDDAGNLLFYTSGETVVNANHEVMPNGFGLFGDESSSQSAIIVPKPQDPNIYYIVTIDTAVGGPDLGLNYSILDMTLEGGLGDITSKNINLLTLCTEKLSAVLKDCQTKSVWIITLASINGDTVDDYDTFHAFEVSNLGINPVPVKSTFATKFTDPRGYLKLSPDGTKLISANLRDGLFLYDFNTNTGIVSNEQQLQINSVNDKPYGVEFSPNSQLLYVHSYNDYNREFGELDSPEHHSSSLFQFDLTALDIQGSQFELDNRQLYRGALQLGPDGRIYRALSPLYDGGYPYLGVINNPNALGLASNYQHNAVDLSPNLSSQGLPPFIQSLFNTQIDIIQNGQSNTSLTLCEGETYTLTSADILGASYSWAMDGNPLSESDFDLEISQSGHYEVYIDPNNGDCVIEGQAFVAFFDNPSVNNVTLLQCDEDGLKDGRTQFNLYEANEGITGDSQVYSTQFYTSLSDAESDINEVNGNAYSNISNPEILYVRVTNNSTQCFSFGEILLDISLTDSNDTELIACDDDGFEDGFYNFTLNDANNDILDGMPAGLDVSYYTTYNDALLEQNKLGDFYTNTTAYSQLIFARVENTNNCFGISEVLLLVNQLPNIELEFLTQYCLNHFPQTISIDGGVIDDSPDDYTYNWSTNEDTYEIQINQSGNYTVTVTNANGCSKDRIVTIEASNIATIQSIQVIDASQNNTISVVVSGDGVYEYALSNNDGIYIPFQTSNSFENISPGIYTVLVRDIKNDCGITEDIVSVIGFPKYFTPNSDGLNDTWQVSGISSMFQPNSIIFIFDRYGKLLKQLDPLGIGWDGKMNGELLPNNDYWFAITLQDGRIFKNHFTLKR
jgi:gliding motility-associated-like protein